ncbi:tetratricopeptide repeat protein [Sorangium sp. So ce1099]|uniref:tetratricopeptide repeat protein n=1 Tax=Sorangium sp. So ce1099 TaxID=3133331 RepID=UPI003F5EE16E
MASLRRTPGAGALAPRAAAPIEARPRRSRASARHPTRRGAALPRGQDRSEGLARPSFGRAGDRRNACVARSNLGFFHAELGDFERAERALRAAMDEAQRMGLHDPVMHALANLGHVLAYRGELAEAERALRQAIEEEERQGDPRAVGTSRTYLAEAHLLAGELEQAEREARIAAAALDAVPPLRAAALAVLAEALLGLGRAGEALAAAGEAMSMLESLGTVEEGESLVRLAHAESLAANGDVAGARAAISAARDRLLARAATVGDPALRELFLARRENARTLALAERWSGAWSSPRV